MVESKIKRVAAAGQAMSAVGAKMTKLVTVPILGLAAASIKVASDFDKGLTNSLAIMGDVSEETADKMALAARKVGRETLIGATEAAEAYFFLASAGLTAEQSIEALPRVAAFAQAGNFDMSTATDLATDALSAMGLKSDDAAQNLLNLNRVQDVLVKGNTLANASVEQFATSLTTKAAAAAKTLGIEIEGTVAILAVMADAGIKGQRAGTQLAMTLNNLSSNAVKNADEFAKLGIEVFDNNGKFKNMADIVDDLSAALGGMTDENKVAAIAALGFGDKAASTIKTMLGMGGAMREYEDKLKSATDFTDIVAAKQLETFSAQMTLLKASITDVGIVIGTALIPIIMDLVEIVRPWIATASDWIDQNTDLALKIGGIAAAIGPVLFMVGKAIRIVTLFTNPIGLIILAIGGFVWWLKEMGVTLDDVLEFFAPVIQVGKDFVEWFTFAASTGDLLNDAITKLPEPLQNVIRKADELRETFVNDVLPGIMESVGNLRSTWDEHWTEISAVGEAAGSLFGTVWSDVIAFAMPLIEDMAAFFAEKFAFISEWVDENMGLILATIEKVLGIILAIWKRVWPAIAGIITHVWNLMKNTITTVLDVFLGLIKLAMSIFTGDWDSAWQAIIDIVTALWDGLWESIMLAWDGFVVIWDTAWAAFMGVWELAWGALGEAASSIWDGIASAVTFAFQTIVNFIITQINMGIRAINSILGLINKIPGVNIADIPELAKIGGGGGGLTAQSARFEDFFPGMANGGVVGRGGMVKVGEGGPELVNLPGGATVTPNESIAGMGGGPMIGELHVQSSDPVEIAKALAWEMRIAGV
jgi:TP901 family phage tail tape measure protein